MWPDPDLMSISCSKQVTATFAVPSEELGNYSGPWRGSCGAKIPWDYDTAEHEDDVEYNPAHFRAGLRAVLCNISEKGVCVHAEQPVHCYNY